MKKKQFQITADMFNNKYLTALMDFLAFVSPAKTKDERIIREKDRQLIASGNLGEPVGKPCANLGGVLDRNRILSGTTLFGNIPEVTENDIKLIAEAGFDFIISENDGEYQENILRWCEKYGVAVIGSECRKYLNYDLSKPDYKNPALFDGFNPPPASVGDGCIDEPHTNTFGLIAEINKAYKSKFPDRFLFSNLLPAGAIKSALGASSYREYVEKYAAEINSDYLSVDIYPFHPSKLLNKAEMAICLNTYHTLGDVCRKNNRDFWLYIQSQMRWFSHLYTMTTFEMIKWQVYTSVAYGCRSIIHASYNPVWGNDAIGLIDYDGNLTEQYLYAKRVNAEIAKLSPVITEYRSLGVTFSESRRLNPHFIAAVPFQRMKNRQQGFDGIKEVLSVKSDGTAVAGYFAKADGGKALMLVNCRNIYNPYASQDITVRFNGKYKLRVYEHGVLTRTETADEITVTAGSCDGIFIEIIPV